MGVENSEQIIKYLDDAALKLMYSRLNSRFVTVNELPAISTLTPDERKRIYLLNDGVGYFPYFIKDAGWEPAGITAEELDDKADRVEGARSGNLAALDAEGNLVDANAKTTDFATAQQGEVAQEAYDLASAAYKKPAGGIPKADMAESVQESLGLADTALQEGDIAGKTDKVSGATAGHFASLNGEGNLADSGVSASDFSKVSASSSNGKIKVDGTDVTVYTHPAFDAVEPGAVQVGRDASGHVVLGDALTKADVGLGQVDNTADADKPISTATQAALDAKQDTLAAGANISIANNTISATDTTYSAGTGLSLSGTTFSADTSVLATQMDLSTGLAAKQDTLVAGANIQLDGTTISATDTTYSAGTGLSLSGTTFGADTTVLATQTDLSTGLAAKQDTIGDLATIRSGAALGATAVQPGDIDQTYSSSSAHAQSGTAVASAISGKQDTVSAGAGISISSDNAISVDTDTIATKTYVAGEISVHDASAVAHQDIRDAIASIGKPLVWKGTKSVAELNAGITGIQEGWTYTLSDSGTLTAGGLAVDAGDEVNWTGSAWNKIGGAGQILFKCVQGETEGSAMEAAYNTGKKLYAVNDGVDIPLQFRDASQTDAVIYLFTRDRYNPNDNNVGNVIVKVTYNKTDGTVSWATDEAVLANVEHVHSASDITSGTLSDERIASAATWNAKQAALTAGTGISIVDNVISSPSEIFRFTYEGATGEELEAAYSAGKQLVCRYENYDVPLSLRDTSSVAGAAIYNFDKAVYIMADAQVPVIVKFKAKVILETGAVEWSNNMAELAFYDHEHSASDITSGTFGTSRIADDSITAAKVKDNETLPVSISGNAATATSATTAAGYTDDGGIATALNDKVNITGNNATSDGVSTMLYTLPEGTGNPNDDTLVVGTKYGENRWIVRKLSLYWNYIKGKIENLLGLTAENYGGNAATATTATDYASTGGIATALAAKQATISDLATIRSGAALGATAVQPSDIDQTYSASSTNAQSGVAVASAISGKQDALTAGEGIAIDSSADTVSFTGIQVDTSYTGSLPKPTGNGTVASPLSIEDFSDSLEDQFSAISTTIQALNRQLAALGSTITLKGEGTATDIAEYMQTAEVGDAYIATSAGTVMEKSVAAGDMVVKLSSTVSVLNTSPQLSEYAKTAELPTVVAGANVVVTPTVVDSHTQYTVSSIGGSGSGTNYSFASDDSRFGWTPTYDPETEIMTETLNVNLPKFVNVTSMPSTLQANTYYFVYEE